MTGDALGLAAGLGGSPLATPSCPKNVDYELLQ
jgi:hypothetical protein